MRYAITAFAASSLRTQAGSDYHLLEQLGDLLLVLRAKVLQGAWSRWRWLGLQGELCWGRVRIGCPRSLSRATLYEPAVEGPVHRVRGAAGHAAGLRTLPQEDLSLGQLSLLRFFIINPYSRCIFRIHVGDAWKPTRRVTVDWSEGSSVIVQHEQTNDKLT